MRGWRKENPEAWSVISINARRRRLYAIEPADYADLLVFQNGRCAICKTADARDRHPNGWCIDHAHSTKVVRGLLCNPCNTVLGYYERYGIPVAKEFVDYLANPPARSVLKSNVTPIRASEES